MIGYTQTPKNGILISKSKISFGTSIGAYLKKKKVERVTIVINYNNNSMAIMDSGDEGYLVSHPNLSYGTSKVSSIEVNVAKFIDLEYVNAFTAKLLNEKTIIVEDLPLKEGAVVINSRLLLKPYSKLIILGNFLFGKDILPEHIERKQSKPFTSALPLSKRPDRLAELPKKQPEPSSKPIDDKKTANNDILDDATSASVSEVEQKRIDSEYSKMILGE